MLYRWFRRWQRDGTWAAVLAVLQAHADAAWKISWMVSMDSTRVACPYYAKAPAQPEQGLRVASVTCARGRLRVVSSTPRTSTHQERP